MKSRSFEAVEYFSEGANCAQAVVMAFQNVLPPTLGGLAKAATGFGAGMARFGQTCGAVSGALLTLGAHLGGDKASGAADACYAAAGVFQESFTKAMGSTLCSDLLGGIDLRTHEGQERFKNRGLRQSVCQECVKRSVEICETILAERGLLD